MNDDKALIPSDLQVTEQPQEVVLIPDTPQNIYQGASAQRFTKEEEEKLRRKLTDDEIEIRPHDGCLYLPEMKYRNRLNDIFGPGAWALIPVGGWANRDKTVAREYALYIQGRFIAQATGEMDIIGGNKNISWATACEGARSNALVRCCKDIGIASELWDKNFDDEWKRKHAKRTSDGWYKVVGEGSGVSNSLPQTVQSEGKHEGGLATPQTATPPPTEEQKRVEDAFEGEETKPEHGDATEPQRRKIHAQMAGLGFKDDLAKCEKASSILGKTPVILSLSVLSKREASFIIEALTKEMGKK